MSPLASGATYQTSISLTATVTTYNAVAFKTALSDVSQIPESSITVSVLTRRSLAKLSAARGLQTSTNLQIVMLAATALAAETAVTRMSQDLSVLSSQLGTTVTAVSAPSVTTVAVAGSGSGGSGGLVDGNVAAQSGGGGSSDDNMAVIVILAVVVVVLIAVVGVVVRRRMMKRTSTIVKAVPVSAVGTTSTTTSPPAGVEMDSKQAEESKI